MDAGSDALSGSIPPGVDGEYKSETRIRLVGCSPRSPHPLLTLKIYICRLREMKLRLSPQTLQVLDAFLQAPKDWIYGYDISRNTGLKSGTLYPILMSFRTDWTPEGAWWPDFLLMVRSSGWVTSRQSTATSAPSSSGEV